MSSTAPAGEPAAGAEINFDDAARRIRELTERILDSAKQTGVRSLDAYEKALEGLVDFEQKAAGATGLDWVTAVANAQIINQLSGAFVEAARSRLQ